MLSILAPKQLMLVDQFRQLLQGGHGDYWRGLVSQGLTSSRIEHPTRYGDAEPVGQSDDQMRLSLAAERPDDLNFLADESVMPVVDPGKLEFMSSVLMS